MFGIKFWKLTADNIEPNNLRRFTVAQRWQPIAGSDPLSVFAQIPRAPAYPPYKPLRPQTNSVGGGYVTEYTFVGPAEAGASFRNPKTLAFEFQAGHAARDIRQCANISELLKSFPNHSDSEGKIIFEKDMTGADGKTQVISPMYGYDAYLDFTEMSIYSWEWVTEYGTLSSAFDTVFQIFEAADLPGKVPKLKGYNFLRLPPLIHLQAGEIGVLGERLAMSGPRGWNNIIYKKYEGNASNSSLQIGQLQTS